jgi:hypothetical protein
MKKEAIAHYCYIFFICTERKRRRVIQVDRIAQISKGRRVVKLKKGITAEKEEERY